MNKKKVLTIVACLASVFLLGEENRDFSLKDINISSVEKSPESDESLLPEKYSEGGDITIKNQHEDNKIAYPLDESNFEEVFGVSK